MIEQFLDHDLEPECNDEVSFDAELLRSNVKEIIKAMYLTGDVAYMESCLDEVCYELNIDIDKGDPVIGMIGKQNFLNFMNT